MYQGFDSLLKGFGDNRTSDDLMKALYSTNSNGGAAGSITQGPLTLENLDGTMTTLNCGRKSRLFLVPMRTTNSTVTPDSALVVLALALPRVVAQPVTYLHSPAPASTSSTSASVVG